MNERLPYLREKTAKLTTSPGVYRMRDKGGNIIYIGKAKNLKNRVSQYFQYSRAHTPKVRAISVMGSILASLAISISVFMLELLYCINIILQYKYTTKTLVCKGDGGRKKRIFP